MEGPTLGFVDVTQSVHVHAHALDGVLVHNEYSIASKSRKSSSAQMSYTMFEEETLAMVHFLRTWRLYSQDLLMSQRPKTLLLATSVISQNGL